MKKKEKVRTRNENSSLAGPRGQTRSSFLSASIFMPSVPFFTSLPAIFSVFISFSYFMFTRSIPLFCPFSFCYPVISLFVPIVVNFVIFYFFQFSFSPDCLLIFPPGSFSFHLCLLSISFFKFSILFLVSFLLSTCLCSDRPCLRHFLFHCTLFLCLFPYIFLQFPFLLLDAPIFRILHLFVRPYLCALSFDFIRFARLCQQFLSSPFSIYFLFFVFFFLPPFSFFFFLGCSYNSMLAFTSINHHFSLWVYMLYLFLVLFSAPALFFASYLFTPFLLSSLDFPFPPCCYSYPSHLVPIYPSFSFVSFFS